MNIEKNPRQVICCKKTARTFPELKTGQRQRRHKSPKNYLITSKKEKVKTQDMRRGNYYSRKNMCDVRTGKIFYFSWTWMSSRVWEQMTKSKLEEGESLRSIPSGSCRKSNCIRIARFINMLLYCRQLDGKK